MSETRAEKRKRLRAEAVANKSEGGVISPEEEEVTIIPEEDIIPELDEVVTLPIPEVSDDSVQELNEEEVPCEVIDANERLKKSISYFEEGIEKKFKSGLLTSYQAMFIKEVDRTLGRSLTGESLLELTKDSGIVGSISFSLMDSWGNTNGSAETAKAFFGLITVIVGVGNKTYKPAEAKNYIDDMFTGKFSDLGDRVKVALLY